MGPKRQTGQYSQEVYALSSKCFVLFLFLVFFSVPPTFHWLPLALTGNMEEPTDFIMHKLFPCLKGSCRDVNVPFVKQMDL